MKLINGGVLNEAEKTFQYAFDLNVGRIGSSLSIFRVHKEGPVVSDCTWKILFNGKGMLVTKSKIGNESILCDFQMLEDAAEIDQEDLGFLEMVSGTRDPEDDSILRLGSFLVAASRSGSSEEEIYGSVRKTLEIL